MRRLWITLSLVLVCGLAGLCAWQFVGTEDTVPWTAIVPATPLEAGATTNQATAESVGVPNGAVHRTDGGPSAPSTDDRIAVLEVRVVCSWPGSAAEEAAPQRDVDVILDAASEAPLRARTDDGGFARFEIPGAHGQTALVASGQRSSTTVRLSAEEPVRTTLRVHARLLVHGSVVDQGGRGIAGADLVLLPWLDPAGQPPRPRLVGRSRADGSFAVVLGAGGRLGAQHPQFAPSAMHLVEPGGDPTAAPTTIGLQLALLTPQARLLGRVTDADGRPVAGAELEFRAAAPAPDGTALAAPPQRARSGRDGRFTAAHLKPGRIEYTARAVGHGSTRGTFDVAPGQFATVEIRLQVPCEVHGVVEAEDGSPVAMARVWSGREDAFDSVSAESDRDGAFRLAGLPPGEVVLSASDGATAPGSGAARRARTKVVLTSGQVGHWVAVLRATSAADGLVGEVVDADGRRLGGWRVLARTGGAVKTTVTDAKGSFALPEPPGPGPIDVLVYAPDAPSGSFASAVRQGIVGTAERVRIVVDGRARGGTLTGRVETTDHRPAAATITCWHLERRESASFQAAGDGVFRLHPVPPGTLNLLVEQAGRVPAARARLQIQANDTLDLGTIVLGEAAALHGQVLGPDGRPPETLQVALVTKDQRIVGEYSAGTYRFAAAPPGEQVLQVQGPTVAAADFVVQLQAGVDLQQDMRLLAGVPRRIAVVGSPQPGTVVRLRLRRKDADASWYGSAILQATSPGRAVGSAEFVACLAPGDYETVAWCDPDWEARAVVHLSQGDDSPVRLELSRH